MKANNARDRALRHPLITAYLDSLARQLDSDEQEEVLQSVREHIVDALATSTIPDENRAVRAVLDELGPVERITAAEEQPLVADHGRPWLQIAAVALAVLSLAGVALVPFVAIPVALGTLALGIVGVVRRRRHERAISWAVIVISGVTLVVALIGALFIVRWGPSEPVDDHTGVPIELPRSIILP